MSNYFKVDVKNINKDYLKGNHTMKQYKKSTPIKWDDLKDKEFIELYPNTNNKQLAKHFKCSYSAIKNRASILKVNKSPDYINAGIFPKNHVPFNKGKKITDYVKDETTLTNIKKAQFKKGIKPHNTKYVGYERISKDGYTEVCVALNKFKFKHRILWEKENGPIPKGYVLVFADGNKQNIVLENLKLITLSENMIRNSIQRFPPELKEVIRLQSSIKRKIIKNQN